MAREALGYSGESIIIITDCKQQKHRRHKELIIRRGFQRLHRSACLEFTSWILFLTIDQGSVYGIVGKNLRKCDNA